MRRPTPSPSTCDGREHKLSNPVGSEPTSPGSLPTSAKTCLLNWFDAHHRDLPWRDDRDPYRIWISEVMLQQTTVAAVIPRFARFLRLFPNLPTLAAADEQDVLKEWEGLGYYSRARNLHRAARILVACGPAIPDDPVVWSDLPGVGPYILGAVLSQAFDRPMPIVEANTTRLLCRLFGQMGDPKSTLVRRWLWQTAENMLPHARVGDFNQALMELGALVCTPANPACGTCPLRRNCVANRKGLQTEIPVRSRRPTTIDVREVCLAIENRGRYLLMRLPASGRWGNMWEFPRVTLTAADSNESARERLLKSLGLTARLGRELISIHYSVTHHRISMQCRLAKTQSARFLLGTYLEGIWLLPAEIQSYPVSVPQRKLAESLRLSQSGQLASP